VESKAWKENPLMVVYRIAENKRNKIAVRSDIIIRCSAQL